MNQPRIAGQGPAAWMGSPLFGRYDKDPGRYRSQWYHCEISVGQATGDQGRGSININNEPFAVVRMSAKIVGDVSNPQVSGIYQDYMYTVEWKDQQRNYVDGPICPDLMWGSTQSGYAIDFPFPLPYSGNDTLSFTITNRVTRVIPEEYFVVQIVVAGITDIGELMR